MDVLHTIDIYKCLFSIGAGLLLGMEREMKDKAAGVKTISIICLGACLFSIISLRFSPERATAMAAYIVSGVGFLGAGVIFKDGVNISGLTTASIIWMAAAVGTSIGFGEFYMSGVFLLGSFLIIGITPYLNLLLASRLQSKIVTISFARTEYNEDHDILRELRLVSKRVTVTKICVAEENVQLEMDILIEKKRLEKFTSYLLSSHPQVTFSI